MPNSSDLTVAFFNRWVIIDFKKTFVNSKEWAVLGEEYKMNNNIELADNEIIKKLTEKEELSGILNWALIGLERLNNNKGFSYSKTTEEIKNFWIRKTNSLMAFVEDCCEISFENILPKRLFRESYQKYCKTHKIKVFSDLTIRKILKETYDVESDRKTQNGVFEHCWIGISYKH